MYLWFSLVEWIFHFPEFFIIMIVISDEKEGKKIFFHTNCMKVQKWKKKKVVHSERALRWLASDRVLEYPKNVSFQGASESFIIQPPQMKTVDRGHKKMKKKKNPTLTQFLTVFQFLNLNFENMESLQIYLPFYWYITRNS